MIPADAQAQATGRSAAGGDRPFTDILCAVDGTHRSYSAVEQAAILAGSSGHLTMLAVTAISGSGAYKTAAIGAERAERILDRAAHLAERAGVRCATEIDPAGPPAEVILQRAEGHDMLAIGAPATSWFGGRVVEGVGGALLKLGSPLLVARSTPGGEERFAQRITVASDGLDGSDEVVELAIRLARGVGASLTIVHAEGSEDRVHPMRVGEQGARIQDELPGSPDARIDIGSPVDAVVEGAAATDSSLIVMGSTKAKGLAAIGSVSRRVLHDAHCSVLLVTPAGD
jgi:nucleotide-binding universal stress UspA family protein